MHIIEKGGGYIGASYLDGLLEPTFGNKRYPSIATWPLVSLVINEKSCTINIVNNSHTVLYSDLKNISVSKSGYIKFNTIRPSDNIAFGNLHLKRIVKILHNNGVRLDSSCTTNIRIAVIVVGIQYALIWVFVALIVFGMTRTAFK